MNSEIEIGRVFVAINSFAIRGLKTTTESFLFCELEFEIDGRLGRSGFNFLQCSQFASTNGALETDKNGLATKSNIGLGKIFIWIISN